jgi:hypothetical protein
MNADVARAIASAEIIPRLPDRIRAEFGDPLPIGLAGGRIIQFGTVNAEVSAIADSRLEGGGLLIDYIPNGEDSRHRLALGFNELGMWVVYHGAVSV